MVLNYDNEASRRTVEQCYRTYKTLVNPILSFSDNDVWEFIRQYNIPYCKLYDEGLKRIGCIGCPLGGTAAQRRDMQRWPHLCKVYEMAFDKMLNERKKCGLESYNSLWTDGKGVMKWWLGYDRQSDPEQITFDDLF